MILRLRSIVSRRVFTLLLMTVLLIATLCISSVNYGGRSGYSFTVVEHALSQLGMRLLALPPGTEPAISAVSPHNYMIDSGSFDITQNETVTIYVFPSATQRAKGEAELRASIARSGIPMPVIYERENLLVVYRPLAIVNQTGTKYGDLLRSALDSL